MKWISVDERLPDDHEVLKVRRKNGDEIKAYFHKDRATWVLFYCKGETSHFQDHKTLEFLFDVTHWKYF